MSFHPGGSKSQKRLINSSHSPLCNRLRDAISSPTVCFPAQWYPCQSISRLMLTLWPSSFAWVEFEVPRLLSASFTGNKMCIDWLKLCPKEHVIWPKLFKENNTSKKLNFQMYILDDRPYSHPPVPLRPSCNHLPCALGLGHSAPQGPHTPNPCALQLQCFPYPRGPQGASLGPFHHQHHQRLCSIYLCLIYSAGLDTERSAVHCTCLRQEGTRKQVQVGAAGPAP